MLWIMSGTFNANKTTHTNASWDFTPSALWGIPPRCQQHSRVKPIAPRHKVCYCSMQMNDFPYCIMVLLSLSVIKEAVIPEPQSLLLLDANEGIDKESPALRRSGEKIDPGN